MSLYYLFYIYIFCFLLSGVNQLKWVLVRASPIVRGSSLLFLVGELRLLVYSQRTSGSIEHTR